VKLIAHVRGIRALCEVAASGSFSSAAQALGMTGLVLVERRTRPAELTEAGRVLARHGKAIGSRLDGAEHELAGIADRNAGRLRLGSFPTALTTFVPAALARLRRERSGIVLTVVDDHMQGLIPRLVDGELDLAVIFDHPAQETAGAERIRRQPLFDDAYRALLPSAHRLARRRAALTLTDLADDVWVGGRPGSTWFRIVRHACQAAGFEPRTSLFSDDYRAVQAFVAAGLGIAVVPGLAALNPIPGIEVKRLAPGSPVRRISVATADDALPPPAVPAMTAILRELTRPLRTPRPPARPRP
jgi:DNA-binding transcriptional LysR family regulator